MCADHRPALVEARRTTRVTLVALIASICLWLVSAVVFVGAIPYLIDTDLYQPARWGQITCLLLIALLTVLYLRARQREAHARSDKELNR